MNFQYVFIQLLLSHKWFFFFLVENRNARQKNFFKIKGKIYSYPISLLYENKILKLAKACSIHLKTSSGSDA